MRRYTRREVIKGAAAGVVAVAAAGWREPGFVSASAAEQEATDRYDLTIGPFPLVIDGQSGMGIAINGSIPGPVIRLKEGREAVLRVRNTLEETTSIHWHGLILPPAMDGVPGVSFAGIKPGGTFVYHFPVRQSGTYWYHSHSGGQEQLGVYGALIIDPAEPDPFSYDNDYVVMLSDWSFESPAQIVSKLKNQAGYYNYQKRTLFDLVRDAREAGLTTALSDRLEWGKMVMDPTDLADVTASTYTYLMNGLPSSSSWLGLFRPGERVRLRFINGAAMTLFDVRIPGLTMTLVQADGQNVHPLEIGEFRIGPGETYDVTVQPKESDAYTIFAETLDRSGYVHGTLATRKGATAPIPERRKRPVRGMADMGMEHSSQMDMPSHGSAHQGGDPGTAPPAVKHGPDHHGIGNSSVAMSSRSRLKEPGIGLENSPHRVLVYADLRSVVPGHDPREPEREIEIHITGHMERYIWSFDGKKYSEAKDPIRFIYGERLRLTLVNDTMMEHPIHLHGMWMELENDTGAHKPRKHTITVKPAERVSVAITADAPGKWAFHCHLLLHMDMGMFRVVEVEGKA